MKLKILNRFINAVKGEYTGDYDNTRFDEIKMWLELEIFHPVKLHLSPKYREQYKEEMLDGLEFASEETCEEVLNDLVSESAFTNPLYNRVKRVFKKKEII